MFTNGVLGFDVAVRRSQAPYRLLLGDPVLGPHLAKSGSSQTKGETVSTPNPLYPDVPPVIVDQFDTSDPKSD